MNLKQVKTKKVQNKMNLKQVMKMPKFKNKKTGKVFEEHLHYYVNKFKNDPNYEEVKEEKKSSETKKTKEVEK